MEDYEDWLCNNEYELLSEFIHAKGLESEFDLWASCKYGSRYPEE